MGGASAPVVGAAIGAAVGGIMFAELGPGDVFAAAITAQIGESVGAALNLPASLTGVGLGTAIANGIWNQVCPSDAAAIPTNTNLADSDLGAAQADNKGYFDTAVYDASDGADDGWGGGGGGGGGWNDDGLRNVDED
jgi:hypothetical protein